MKKKLIALSLAAVMVLSMAGCGSKNIKLNERTKTFEEETTQEQETSTGSAETETVAAVAEVDRNSLTSSEAPQLARFPLWTTGFLQKMTFTSSRSTQPESLWRSVNTAGITT